MTFWRNYWGLLKDLPRNWGVWLIVLMVLGGGHSPKGKVIAIALLILFMPIFQMMFRFEQKTPDKEDSKIDHKKIWEKLDKIPGSNKSVFDIPFGPTKMCLTTRQLVDFVEDGEKKRRLPK